LHDRDTPDTGPAEQNNQREEAVARWRALRVGLFIHWGPSSEKALPHSHSHARKSALNPRGSVPTACQRQGIALNWRISPKDWKHPDFNVADYDRYYA
jgi:hypothetical protein